MRSLDGHCLLENCIKIDELRGQKMEIKSTWPFAENFGPGSVCGVDMISFVGYQYYLEAFQDQPGSSAICRVHGGRKITESP